MPMETRPSVEPRDRPASFEGRTPVATGGTIGIVVAADLTACGAHVLEWSLDKAAPGAAHARPDVACMAEVEAADARADADGPTSGTLVHAAGLSGATAPAAARGCGSAGEKVSITGGTS